MDGLGQTTDVEDFEYSWSKFRWLQQQKSICGSPITPKPVQVWFSFGLPTTQLNNSQLQALVLEDRAAVHIKMNS